MVVTRGKTFTAHRFWNGEVHDYSAESVKKKIRFLRPHNTSTLCDFDKICVRTLSNQQGV